MSRAIAMLVVVLLLGVVATHAQSPAKSPTQSLKPSPPFKMAAPSLAPVNPPTAVDAPAERPAFEAEGPTSEANSPTAEGPATEADSPIAAVPRIASLPDGNIPFASEPVSDKVSDDMSIAVGSGVVYGRLVAAAVLAVAAF